MQRPVYLDHKLLSKILKFSSGVFKAIQYHKCLLYYNKTNQLLVFLFVLVLSSLLETLILHLKCAYFKDVFYILSRKMKQNVLDTCFITNQCNQFTAVFTDN